MKTVYPTDRPKDFNAWSVYIKNLISKLQKVRDEEIYNFNRRSSELERSLSREHRCKGI